MFCIFLIRKNSFFSLCVSSFSPKLSNNFIDHPVPASPGVSVHLMTLSEFKTRSSGNLLCLYFINANKNVLFPVSSTLFSCQSQNKMSPFFSFLFYILLDFLGCSS